MIRNIKEVERWLLLPLFVVLISATSAAAKDTSGHFGWVDEADHLFRGVAEGASAPRTLNGTVTRTASQARAESRIDHRDDLVKTVPAGVREPAAVAKAAQTETTAGSIESLRATRAQARPASNTAGRRGVESGEQQELRQLRAENRRLKWIVSGRAIPASIVASRR